jgi:predicted amidohydrolase
VIRTCAAQISLKPGNVGENLSRCLGAIEESHRAGVDLLVLPECALSGYILDEEQSRAAAVELEGVELSTLTRAVKAVGIHAVVGFLERDGSTLYNAAALISPSGMIASYRKRHIPFVGADRFVQSGPNVGAIVAETPLGRVGLNICYDIRFPESARTVALAGADLIAQPTNWPIEAVVVATHFPIVRAAENRVFLVIANRGDSENGVSFIGMSQIVAPSGDVVARAERGDTMLIADIDLEQARRKKVVVQPGAYEIDLWRDRHPEMYAAIVHGLVDEGAEEAQAK